MNKTLKISIIAIVILIIIIFLWIVFKRYKLYKQCQEDSSKGYKQNDKPIKCKFSFDKSKIAYT